MPTIEIVSLGAEKFGLDQSEFDLLIIEENKLLSHRGLFYDVLKKQIGSIIHIGNPDLKYDKEGGCFAGKIIDWSFKPGWIILPDIDRKETRANQDFQFKFKVEFQKEIAKIINIGFQNSPSKNVYFLTDYQFGPEKATIKDMRITDFWEFHGTQGLSWNVLYNLKK